MGIFSHLAGLLGQRLYFGWKTKKYTNRLKINPHKCIGCGLCKNLCPMSNITIKNGHVISSNKCTMCYRCISRCPEQAITLLGKRITDQNDTVSRFLWNKRLYVFFLLLLLPILYFSQSCALIFLHHRYYRAFLNVNRLL